MSTPLLTPGSPSLADLFPSQAPSPAPLPSSRMPGMGLRGSPPARLPARPPPRPAPAAPSCQRDNKGGASGQGPGLPHPVPKGGPRPPPSTGGPRPGCDGSAGRRGWGVGARDGGLAEVRAPHPEAIAPYRAEALAQLRPLQGLHVEHLPAAAPAAPPRLKARGAPGCVLRAAADFRPALEARGSTQRHRRAAAASPGPAPPAGRAAHGPARRPPPRTERAARACAAPAPGPAGGGGGGGRGQWCPRGGGRPGNTLRLGRPGLQGVPGAAEVRAAERRRGPGPGQDGGRPRAPAPDGRHGELGAARTLARPGRRGFKGGGEGSGGGWCRRSPPPSRAPRPGPLLAQWPGGLAFTPTPAPFRLMHLYCSVTDESLGEACAESAHTVRA